MSKSHDLALPVRRFFEDHLVSQRGLSQHTILSYRDTLKLLFQFAAQRGQKSCTDLALSDITPDLVRAFLDHLGSVRHNSVGTRNIRMAAIHAFFRYLAAMDPRLMAQCQQILALPFKRHNKPVLGYLEKEEIQCIFRHIDVQEPAGRRDDALLRLLYNTGARAQEAVDLNVCHIRFSRPHYARIQGKGRRERTCPLWEETMRSIRRYVEDRQLKLSDNAPLFINAKGDRLSRFGLRYMITQRVAKAGQACPSLLTRKVTPHTFRHTTAMHLLQAGVDLNMIRSWLGHASIETTNLYVEIDLEMKRKTLQPSEKLLPKTNQEGPSWQRDPSILDWLAKL